MYEISIRITEHTLHLFKMKSSMISPLAYKTAVATTLLLTIFALVHHLTKGPNGKLWTDAHTVISMVGGCSVSILLIGVLHNYAR